MFDSLILNYKDYSDFKKKTVKPGDLQQLLLDALLQKTQTKKITDLRTSDLICRSKLYLKFTVSYCIE